tara:strand:- start:26863 stop:27201 length:339 start_codon:yes stop_codon:yes gene_type:complete
VTSNRFLALIALIAPLAMPSNADSSAPCRDKELWFETGIGYYSEGYGLEGAEKKARSLYRMMEGEPFTEDEAIAIALQAWHFLDSENASTHINQIERIGLAHSYYIKCLEQH